MHSTAGLSSAWYDKQRTNHAPSKLPFTLALHTRTHARTHARTHTHTGFATAVTGVTITSPGPDLFAADANSVSLTRIPKQVTVAAQTGIAVSKVYEAQAT